MKKLIIGLFALCTAIAAQAAYVDWQYMVTENKTGGTDWTSGHTAYLLTATAYEGLGSNFDQSALASAATDSSTFYQASSTKSAVVYSTGAGGSSGIRQVEADSGNYYVILATSEGYNVAVNNVAITAYSDPSAANTGMTPGVTIKSPATGSSIAYTTYPTGGGGTGGVPEPTSGLLLALGGAMLALRRRRA